MWLKANLLRSQWILLLKYSDCVTVSKDIIPLLVSWNAPPPVSAQTFVRANYAHSRPDFIAKFQIALKECYETEYWLELMERAEICKDETVSALLHDCGSIRRLLISSVNTAKQNMVSD